MKAEMPADMLHDGDVVNAVNMIQVVVAGFRLGNTASTRSKDLSSSVSAS